MHQKCMISLKIKRPARAPPSPTPQYRRECPRGHGDIRGARIGPVVAELHGLLCAIFAVSLLKVHQIGMLDRAARIMPF